MDASVNVINSTSSVSTSDDSYTVSSNQKKISVSVIDDTISQVSINSETTDVSAGNDSIILSGGDHNELTNRDISDQHPITAITGLSYELANTMMQYGTTEEWNSNISFIPRKGQIIVYSDYDTETVEDETINIPNFKVGDGLAYLVDLPFANQKTRDMLESHISNSIIHVTSEEREFWNNKVSCYTDIEGSENVIFTKN